MALQGFDSSYYLAQKFAALQAAETEWASKTQSDLETILINIYGGTAATAAEAHYQQYGYAENIGPNAYFNATEYKAAKAKAMFNASGSTYLTEEDALAAFNAAWTGDAYLHYIEYGSAEGVNPSNAFDESSYLATKLAALQADSSTATEWASKTTDDVKAAFAAAGLSALGHYMTYGKDETGVTVTTVPASEQVPSGTTTVGQTYSLTQATDNITGTINDDSINAYLDGGAATLSSLDVIDGAAGTDTLTAFGMDLDNVTETNITNVEKLVFQSTATGTLNMAQLSGVTSVTDQNSTANATFAGMTTGIEMSVLGRGAATATFTYGATALAGSADSATLNLTGTTGTVTIAGSVASTNALETLTINSTGSASVLTALTNIAGLATVNVTGSANLTTTTDFGASTTTFDASAFTGNLNVDFDAAVHTITGGSGDDNIDMENGLAVTDTVDGGAGTDTLVVSTAVGSAAIAARATNFEVLSFSATGQSQDASFFTGISTYTIDAAIATLALTNLAQSSTFNMAFDMATSFTASLASNTASDAITVNIGGTTGGVTAGALVLSTDYETVTVNSQGTAANVITAWGGAAEIPNVVITGSTAITLTTTVGVAGVVDMSGMTDSGSTVTVTDTTDQTLLFGSGNDTLTATGLVAANQTQVIDGGAGNDTLALGAIVTTNSSTTLKGGAGDDILTGVAVTGANAVIAKFDGGEGWDTITLSAQTATTFDVVSTATTVADSDKISNFVTTKDDFDYNGTVKNDTATTITAVANATLAGGLAADADATVYIVTTALGGGAQTAMTALAAATTAATTASLYATFEAALAASLGTITGLDTTLGTDETVLLNIDDGTNSVILKVTNTDTSTANTLTVDELDLVAVMVAGDDLAVGDFI